jgi:hypothetical protein
MLIAANKHIGALEHAPMSAGERASLCSPIANIWSTTTGDARLKLRGIF